MTCDLKNPFFFFLMEQGSLSGSKISLNNFEKGNRISQGSFGKVYKVKEKSTGKLYAAKVIECWDNKEQCDKMINREVNIMFSCKHPTIIKIIGYSNKDFLNENNIVIIMELAKNGSLYDVIKSIIQGSGPKDFTNTTKQIILAGIARGMKYLHYHSIIHRDLKLGNILLDDDFHPLITDFGLSKFYELGNSYSQSQYGGTIIYQAPELLKNAPYDTKVDVYAFGILMYEIINDKFAYPELESGEITEFDFKNKVINQNYRPKFEYPIKETLKELIEKCWDNDPKKRPTFGDIFDKLSATNDTEYFISDDIDFEEFKYYVDEITELTDLSEKLFQENEKLKQELMRFREFVYSIKNKKLDNVEYYIPIGKSWNKCENENSFGLTENHLTFKVVVSSSWDSRFYPINALNGRDENQKKLQDCWSTKRNDKNAFFQVEFSKPVVVNVLLIKSRFRFFIQTPNHFEIFGLVSNDCEPVSLGEFYEFGWESNDKKLFPFLNEQEYTIYKIKLYDSSDRTNYQISFSEMNLGRLII